MKNKIQPAQYKPYDLISETGNISIDSGLDYFNIDLSESIIGNFDIEGSLKISGFNVISPDISNSISQEAYSNGSRVLFGNNNVVNGSQNVIINGNDNNLTGTNNLILFGNNSDLIAQDSVAIGNNISINHNGAAVFADTTSSSKNSQTQNSLTIEYMGGVFVRSKTHFSEDVFSDSNFTITGAISGLSLTVQNNANFLSNINISGSSVFNQSANFYQNISVLGTANLQQLFVSGSRVLTSSELDSYKTFASNTFATKSQLLNLSTEVNTQVANVSSQLPSKLDINTFYQYTNSNLPASYVAVSGNQEIRGIKSFKNPAKFCDGLIFESINNCDRYIPKFGDSSGEAGYMVYSGNYLYVATGTNRWGRILISPWNTVDPNPTTQAPTTQSPTTSTTTTQQPITTTTSTTSTTQGPITTPQATTTSTTSTTTTSTSTSEEPTISTSPDPTTTTTTTTSEEPTTTTTTTTTTSEEPTVSTSPDPTTTTTTTTTTNAPRYEFAGQLCNGGGNVSIWLEFQSFDISHPAYANSTGPTKYDGFFIFTQSNTETYFYTNGAAVIQSCPTPPAPRYQFAGKLCNNDDVSIYIENQTFNISYIAYTNSTDTTKYDGFFTFDGNTYFYNNGVTNGTSNCS